MRSLHSDDGLRCVDLRVAEDGSWAWDEWRCDPEDGGRWTRVAVGLQGLPSCEAALEAARAAAAWLAGEKT